MRLATPVLALAALVVLSHPASARLNANPGPPRTLDISGSRAAVTQSPATPMGAQATQAVNVPLAAGAVQLDSVWYDLQDMGSLGTRIIVAGDGTVHLTWQDDFCELAPGGCPPNQGLPQPYPMRGMAYAYKAPAAPWTYAGKVTDPTIRGCCATELFGGFGTLSLTPNGRAAISQHMNEEGCDLRGNFYVGATPGGSTWKAYLSPIESPSYLFPQVVALPNGSFTMVAEVPRAGSYDEVLDFKITRLAAEGANFVCPVGWQNGPWTSIAPSALYRGGLPAFPSIAASSNGRVGVAVPDFGGNVFLIESSNGTFAAGTITIRNLTSTTDAQVTSPDSTSTQFRSYIHCHLAYNDTTPNVVWSELQARRIGGQVQFFDHRSRIRHWDPVHGITTVKQVQAGEADRYDDVDQGLSGPLCAINHITVDWPQVGFSADGSETYVAWLRFVDGEVDPTATEGLAGICTGTGFGDIAMSLRKGAGAWSPAQNLTNTPQTDERYFSLAARNPNGRAHIVYQCSATNEAGSAVLGDRGTVVPNILRRIAYLEVPIAGTTVGVGDRPRATLAPSLRAWPNPARGHVSFAIDAGGVAGTIEVLSAEGRLVARVPVSAGAAAIWNGKDRYGRTAASGLYFARVQGAPPGTAARFLFLR
jgi:hypothetical protein